MAEIALPAYLDEINTLIDEGRPGEAIVHARHILKQYPRHIDAYRLLAKALLEQEQFADAADLFRRVLSAFPNDFIAHVGLAIVRKEAGEIEEALWHMERAFEIEPYNAPIREELRDLYERRDGVPPEQLALTRPALARLYVKGELYQQAVAELNSLLADEPSPIGLQVLLAEALWRDEQRVGAVNLCLDILDRLPNCIEANAILAEIWLLTGRIEEAQRYLRRVQAVTQLSRADLLGDSAVVCAFRTDGAFALPEQIRLERLPEEDALGLVQAADEQEWVEEDDLGEGDDFGWLRAMEDEESAPATPSPPLADEEVASATEEEPFDWLDEDDEEDLPAAAAAEEPLAEQEKETSSELPEWFVDTAEGREEDEDLFADELADTDRPPAADEADEVPDWLEVFDDEDADLVDAAAWLSDSGGEMDDLSGEETDWEEWLEADVADEAGADPQIPDWLSEPTTLSEGEAESAGGEEEPPPDWLSAAADSAAVNEVETADVERSGLEPPDDEFELEEVAMGTSEEPRKEQPEEELPEKDDPETADSTSPAADLDWLQQLGEVEEDSTPAGDGEAVPNSAEDLPDWLRQDMETVEDSGDSLDWLTEESRPEAPVEQQDTPAVEEPESAVEVAAEDGDDEELPDADEDLSWLDQIAAGEGDPIEEPPTFSWPEEEEEGEATETLLPAAGMEGQEIPTTGVDDGPDAASTADLDWLDEMEAGDDADWLGAEEPAAYEEADTFTEPSAAGEEAEAEWLGAAESAAEAEDADLDWLDEIDADDDADWLGAEEPAAYEYEEEETITESSAADEEEEPEWLAAAEPAAAEAEDADLDWLDEMEADDDADWLGAEEPAADAEEETVAEPYAAEEGEEPEWLAAAEPAADAEETDLDWLGDLETEEEVDWLLDEEPVASATGEAAEEAAASGRPDSESDLEVEAPAIEPAEEPAAEASTLAFEMSGDDEALDWLDDLDIAEETQDDWPVAEEPQQPTVADDAEGAGWLGEAEIFAEEEALPDQEEEAPVFAADDVGGEEETSGPSPEATAADTAVAPTSSEDEVPEDLEEAMAWLERLAAQQGAPLEELPSVEVGAEMSEEADALLAEIPDDEEEALAWLESLAEEQESAEVDDESSVAAVADSESAWLDDSELEDEQSAPAGPEDPALREQLAAAGGVDAEAGPVDEVTVDGAVDDFFAEDAEAEEGVELDWLDDLAAEESVPDLAPEDQSLLAEVAASDEQEEPISGIDELADEEGVEALLAETPEDGSDVPADEETSAARADQEESEQEELGQEDAEPESLPETASEEDLAWMETLAEAGDEADPTVLDDTSATAEDEVPEDLEEAMAWLEQLAAQQGAPVEELPYVQQADPSAPLADEEAMELPDAVEAGAAIDAEESVEDDGVEPVSEAEVMSEPELASATQAPEADEVPEDLEEAMAWLEQLAAQQGAPLDELPSVRTEAAVAESIAEGEPAVGEEEVASGEQAGLEAAGRPDAPAEDHFVQEPAAEVDEAMAWLDQIAAEPEDAPPAVAPDLSRPSLSEEIPDDPDAALAWLEQLAGVQEEAATGEPATAAEAPPVVAEQETPAVPQDVVSAAAAVEADPGVEDLSALPPMPEEDSGADEEEMLDAIPEDPDEAMAWLEQLAARQGASLEELPSVREVADEVATPDWLEREAAEAAREEAEEEAVRTEAARQEAAQAEVEDDSAAGSDDLDWLGELVDEEHPLPSPEPETPTDTEMEPAEESDVADFGFELPEANLDEALPDWLALDDSAEAADFLWEDEDGGVTDWLTAEEEVTLHGPEPTAPPEREPAPPVETEPESAPPAAAPAESLSRPAVPAGVNLDREQLEAARAAVDAGDYGEAANLYQGLLDAGDGLRILIADLEIALAEAERQPLLSRLLGDAYMLNGQLQKALECYRGALDML